ncbi:membrane or secreted protein [Neorhodopirellula lusitana]|uniref:membrane or secreted protein n=1 Tax=Neorhodopirellula lusitana TaxID=445327 RepID=UPI00384AB99D
MPTLLRLIVLKMAISAVVIMIVTGCGPSGRDLSDRQWLDMQQGLQAERAEVGRQRDYLESDRREFNNRERSDPILAATITSASLLMCCCLPLLMVAVLLWPRRSHATDQDVHDAWMDDVVVALVEETSTTRRLAQSAAAPRLAKSED